MELLKPLTLRIETARRVARQAVERFLAEDDLGGLNHDIDILARQRAQLEYDDTCLDPDRLIAQKRAEVITDLNTQAGRARSDA